MDMVELVKSAGRAGHCGNARGWDWIVGLGDEVIHGSACAIYKVKDCSCDARLMILSSQDSKTRVIVGGGGECLQCRY